MNIDLALALAEPLVFTIEGCRLTAYLDRMAKPPVWTIGHGSTFVDGHAVHPGLTCTKLQADAWAAADLRQLAEQVMRFVKVTIDEHQLAALISLAYNIGIGDFERSTVLEALNMAAYQRAADRFLEYDEAGGKAIAGLETRRGRERALFLTGTGHPASPPSAAPHLISVSTGSVPVHEAQAQPPHAKPVEPTTDELNERELDKLEPGGTGHPSPSEPDPPPAAA